MNEVNSAAAAFGGKNDEGFDDHVDDGGNEVVDGNEDEELECRNIEIHDICALDDMDEDYGDENDDGADGNDDCEVDVIDDDGFGENKLKIFLIMTMPIAGSMRLMPTVIWMTTMMIVIMVICEFYGCGGDGDDEETSSL
jgi:hypothetical protein